MSPEDEYLIIACDGLWDTVEPHKAVELVYKHVNAGNSLECKLSCDFELNHFMLSFEIEIRNMP